MADHAGAAADVALLDRPAARGGEGQGDVLGLDVEAVDVVEMAVPGLGHDRQRPPVARGIGPAGMQAFGDHRIADHANAVRVGQHDRPLELARFVDPGRAGHLAVAVEGEPAGEDRAVGAGLAARQDRGDPGAHLVAVGQVLDQGDLANGDASDVGDRIERAWLAFERHAEITRARFGSGRQRANRVQHENTDRTGHRRLRFAGGRPESYNETSHAHANR